MSCKPCGNQAAMRRHLLDIYRAPTGKDDRGQKTGEPVLVAAGILYSFRPLTGRETETARQLFAAASSVVTLHLNRSWHLTPADWFIRRSGPHAGRALQIGYIKDFEGLGLNTEILCGEGVLS